MEPIIIKSPETISFTKNLDEIIEAVKQTFKDRTPHLNGEKYLTNKDIRKMLQMSERTMQTYRDNGAIGYIQISGKILYKESDILKWLEENYYRSYR